MGLFPVLLATALPRRGCVSRRRGAELAFLGRRCEAVVFLGRWRVFAATVFYVDLTSLD